MTLSRIQKDRPIVEIGVKVPLTAAERRRLRALADRELRSVSGAAAWLVSRALEQRHDPRRGVVGASAGDRRTPYSMNLRLPAALYAELQARARVELRTASGLA